MKEKLLKWLHSLNDVQGFIYLMLIPALIYFGIHLLIIYIFDLDVFLYSVFAMALTFVINLLFKIYIAIRGRG